MSGNEVGDKVHNFFGQETMSQSQRHLQSIDSNRPGLTNNLWVGDPFISKFKNYNLQQPDQERGYGNQPSHMSHGLNFTQTNLKPEFGRVQNQNQQPVLNGYVHGNQVFHSRQNETHFLGTDADTNRLNLVARGLSISQQGHTSEHSKNSSMRLDASESPVGFDFFGGQQQMSNQHLNAFLSRLPGNSDMQMLQRQLMFQQLQELQRQQQFQQIEPRQESFINQVSPIIKQTSDNYSSSLINGPINEVSNNLWQSQLVLDSTNWQRGMFSTEQGQSLRPMDMIRQPADQSLYEVPISSRSGSYSQTQMDKQQELDRMQVETRSPVQEFHRKCTYGQGLSSGSSLESFQQVNHSLPMQEFHGSQELAESSESSLQEKSFNQVSALDPTEEKILFGSDDNLWEAFGKSSNTGMGGYDVIDNTDFSSGFSSLQSGSWSALMQSAVAETPNSETGMQEEWCGPTSHNSEAHQQLSVNHAVNPQGVWGGDSNFQPSIAPSSRQSSVSADAIRPDSGMTSFGSPQLKSSQAHDEMLQADCSPRFILKFPEQASWSDRGPLQKQSVEPSHTYASIHPSSLETNANSNLGSWNCQQTASVHDSAQSYDGPDGWNLINSGPANCVDDFKTPEDKNSLQSAPNEFEYVAGIWRTDSNAELQPAKPSMESPRVGGNANSSILRPNQQVDFWKVADSSAGSQRSQQNVFGSTHVTYEPSQGYGHNLAGSLAQIVNKASYSNVQGGHSTAGFPYARNLENQLIHATSGKNLANQSVNRTNYGSEQIDDSAEEAQFVRQDILESKDQISVQQGVFSNMPSNSWTSVPCEQSSLAPQPLFKVDNNRATPFYGQLKLNAQDRESYQRQMLAQKTLSVSQRTESVADNPSLASHTASQKSIEAFDLSLRPNSCLQQNDSLLHQVQALKGTEIGSTDWKTKRLKGLDNVMDPHQSSDGYNTTAGDSFANHASDPSGDLKMSSFSFKPENTQDSYVSSQDRFAFSRNTSWFDQHGTLKNGMQAYDMQQSFAVKSVEQPIIVGKVIDDLHSRDSSDIAADGTKLCNIQEDSASQLIPQVTDQSLVVSTQKKRKSTTSELLSWHSGLKNTSKRLQTISVAELEWAKATNRLPEKVEEECVKAENNLAALRARRRLVLTTQLMQQLLRPPPSALLSSNENSAYFSARLALIDACTATTCCGEDTNRSVEKLKTPNEVDHHFSKVVEDFIGRGRGLENELLRLDKRASILDLRVECQELEKLSVINRFAKFHGRGQSDGTDKSLSDQRPVPQKCVTAVHLQCLEIHQTWYNVIPL